MPAITAAEIAAALGKTTEELATAFAIADERKAQKDIESRIAYTTQSSAAQEATKVAAIATARVTHVDPLVAENNEIISRRNNTIASLDAMMLESRGGQVVTVPTEAEIDALLAGE